jgi:DNA-binding NarL/FixJ family response regulator
VSRQAPTALLVEDHTLMGQMMARFLHERGALAIWAIAASAEEALQKLAGAQGAVEELPDLVLVDLSLGDTSGLALLDDLAALYPQLPCLVVSGHADDVYVRQALAKGARGYVLKGQPEALLKAIRRVLRGESYVWDKARNDREENH